MSLEQYHFHMVLRQEQMTRAERLEADERAARIVQGLSRLWRALRRPAAAHPYHQEATMRPRRIS